MIRNTAYVETAEKLQPAKFAAIACLRKVPHELVHAAVHGVFSELRIANTVTFNTKDVKDRLLTSIKANPNTQTESNGLVKLDHLLESESAFFWHVVTVVHGDCVFSKKESTLTFLKPLGVSQPHTVDPITPPTTPHVSGGSMLGRAGEILGDLQCTSAHNQVDVEQVVQDSTPPLITIEQLLATIEHLTLLRNYEYDELCKAKDDAVYWRSHSIDLERECRERHQCHFYSNARHDNQECRTHFKHPNDRHLGCPFHHIGERQRGPMEGSFKYALFQGTGVGYEWEELPLVLWPRLASSPRPPPTPVRSSSWESDLGVLRSRRHFSVKAREGKGTFRMSKIEESLRFKKKNQKSLLRR